MEQTAEQIAIRARDRYENDHHFRQLVTGAVGAAMAEHGRVDPDRADSEAGNIAVRACRLLLERVFTEDAELNAQRHIADQFRKMAENALAFAPPPMFLAPREPTASA